MNIRLFRAFTLLEAMTGFMIFAIFLAIAMPSISSIHSGGSFPLAFIFAVILSAILTVTVVSLWLRFHHRRHRRHVAAKASADA